MQYRNLIGQKCCHCLYRWKSNSLTNQFYFSRYTTFHFMLQIVLFYNQWLSTKKQNSSLCKLYSIYEEIPEEFLDETPVDSYFYHNILDILQSHHRIVWVSKGSNKKSLAFKVFQFCDSKLQQRFILKEEVSISINEIECVLDSLGEVLKIFWSSQQCIADSNTQTKNWDWVYGSKRRTVQSLLQGYGWAFEQTNSIIVSVWKEQDMCIFHQKVWTIWWSIPS